MEKHQFQNQYQSLLHIVSTFSKVLLQEEKLKFFQLDNLRIVEKNFTCTLGGNIQACCFGERKCWL